MSYTFQNLRGRRTTGRIPAQVLRDQLLALVESRGVRAGVREFVGEIRDMVEARELRLSDFALPDLAGTFLGEEGPQFEAAYARLAGAEGPDELAEAGTPVLAAAFPQLTSQLMFSEVREGFELEANVFYPRFRKVPSEIVGQEIIPAVTRLGDKGEAIGENQEYPRVVVGEEYFVAPNKTKKGMVIELSREVLRFANKQGLVVESAQKIGEDLGIAAENACCDVVLGVVNNYNRNGTASDTYQTASPWINRLTGLVLNDWSAIDALDQLFAAILDPNTSEPLTFMPKHLVVMPYKAMTAKRILSATEVRSRSNPAAGTQDQETISGNPISGLELVVSKRLYLRAISQLSLTAAKARDGVFYGDLEKAFAWLSCWDLEVSQRTKESDASFYRDADMAFKASFFGAAAAREPRHIARGENQAWS